jgi:hypothetical protein
MRLLGGITAVGAVIGLFVAVAVAQFCGDGAVDLGEQCDLGLRAVRQINTLTRMAGSGPATRSINATFRYSLAPGSNMAALALYGLEINGQYDYRYQYAMACGDAATDGNGTAIELSVTPQNVDPEFATSSLVMQWTYWSADDSTTCDQFGNASRVWSPQPLLKAFSFRWTDTSSTTVYLYWSTWRPADALAPNAVHNDECCTPACLQAPDTANLVSCPGGGPAGLGSGPSNFTCRPGGLCAYAGTYVAAEPMCPYESACGLGNGTYWGCNWGVGEMCALRSTTACTCGSEGVCGMPAEAQITAPCIMPTDCTPVSGLIAYCDQNCCAYYAVPPSPSPTSLPTASSTRAGPASASSSPSPTDTPALPEDGEGSSSSSSSSTSSSSTGDVDSDSTPSASKTISESRTPTRSIKGTHSATRSVTPSPSVKPTPHKNYGPIVAGVVGGTFGFCALLGVVCAGGFYFWHHYMLPEAAVVPTPQAFIPATQSTSQAAGALIGWRMAVQHEMRTLPADDDLYGNF